MTVRELIAQLSKIDPEQVVFFESIDNDDGPCIPIQQVADDWTVFFFNTEDSEYQEHATILFG